MHPSTVLILLFSFRVATASLGDWLELAVRTKTALEEEARLHRCGSAMAAEANLLAAAEHLGEEYAGRARCLVEDLRSAQDDGGSADDGSSRCSSASLGMRVELRYENGPYRRPWPNWRYVFRDF